MSRTFRQPGKVLTWTNGTGGAVAAGDVVVMGDAVGVALVDIPNGEAGSVSVTGVHDLPKDGSALTQGDLLDWDVDNGQFIPSAAPGVGNTHVRRVAYAAADAAAGDATAEVVLENPGENITGT